MYYLLLLHLTFRTHEQHVLRFITFIFPFINVRIIVMTRSEEFSRGLIGRDETAGLRVEGD